MTNARELLDHYRNSAGATSDAETPPDILQALHDPGVFDEVRGRIEDSDRDLILKLGRSDRREQRLAAHILGRRFVHGSQDREVFATFEQGYVRAINESDLFLQISFFHDLMEDSNFALQHRQEFVELVRARRSDVRDVLLRYSHGDEETLLRTFQNRLAGVLTSEVLSRYNAPEKAFLYVLYLGCILDPYRRLRARQTLEEWQGKGDDFFNSIVQAEIEQLRA